MPFSLPLLSQEHHHPLHSHTINLREDISQARRENTTTGKMAKDLPSYDHLVEDDYIDMDISSTTFLCYTMSSPPHPNSREFEFQMSTNPPERETTPSPADELFYKGKLLPLHLPPRLQMVQKLLQNSDNNPHCKDSDPLEENMVTTTTNKNTATTTPFDSCNISPATSCHASGELNPEEYFYECPAGLVQSHPKKSWSKKLKLIKQSSLGLKLKASRAHLKSFFTKSGCSDEPSPVPKAKDCSNEYTKAEKKNPFWKIQKERYLVADTNATAIMKSIGQRLMEEDCGHRRSFSGAINRHSTTKSSSETSSCSSSSSSSVNSGGLYGPQMLKRSSSVNSEFESSIQGAIAHCKKSQQLVYGRKSVSDVGYCSLSASRIAAACENQERPALCRGW